MPRAAELFKLDIGNPVFMIERVNVADSSRLGGARCCLEFRPEAKDVVGARNVLVDGYD